MNARTANLAVVVGLLIVVVALWVLPGSPDYNDGVRLLISGLVVVGWGAWLIYDRRL